MKIVNDRAYKMKNKSTIFYKQISFESFCSSYFDIKIHVTIFLPFSLQSLYKQRTGRFSSTQGKVCNHLTAHGNIKVY